MRDNRAERIVRTALILAAGLWAGPRPARAADFASLQFTIPTPDPVQAGETLSVQALAVNTGNSAWAAGSYYWVAEIYDLDNKLVARTDQVSPTDAVPAGSVAAITLKFPVPETYFGRRLYRVFLVKDAKTLLESDYKPFQIVEKTIPPPPEVVDYRLEGNLTMSYKNTSRGHWENHNGATTINAVGKIKDSSYLFNTYILHLPGRVFDPFIVLFTYYAPWGTVYGGDVVPTLNPLSVAGQGMRGAMLEQKRGIFDWTVLGGQTINSQAGTATTNGRYARSLYAAKGTVRLLDTLKLSVNSFLSSDETGSLSSDPKSPNFRGPTLTAQKNSGYGVDLSWEPKPRLVFLADYQTNQYYADASKAGVKANAVRGEIRWEQKFFSWKSFMQRAGTGFVAFGAPAVVGDRITLDSALSVFPVSWYTLSLSGNQYRDNLSNDPQKVSTTQRVVNIGNAFKLPTGTGLNLSGSLNSARGSPSTTLDNQTTTVGLGVSQAFKGHMITANVQSSQFRDKNKISHDLDTQTASLSTNFRLPRSWSTSFGVTQSGTKDKIDGSKRSSLSVSPSLSVPIRPGINGQLWGALSKTKNTSPSFPADTSTLSINSEVTWTVNKQTNLTFGLGRNQNKDNIRPDQSYSEITASTRFSYSF